jgi:uncharacterized protein YqgC (DUF456 family)
VVTPGRLGILAGLVVSGEAAELFTSLFTARRAGGSRRAAWGGVLGGILGMVFLSFLLPVPLIGSMFGALVGCFAGAALAEYSLGRKLGQGASVGVSSAIGFALGVVIKTSIALMMTALVVWPALRFTRSRLVADPSSTALLEQFRGDGTHLVRAGNGAFVTDLEHLGDSSAFDEIRRREPILLVEEFLDSPVLPDRAVFLGDFDLKDESAAFG